LEYLDLQQSGRGISQERDKRGEKGGRSEFTMA